MVGTLTNQNPASSVHKVRKARMVHKAHKAHKVVGKKSGFYVNEVVQLTIDPTSKAHKIGCGGDKVKGCNQNGCA